MFEQMSGDTRAARQKTTRTVGSSSEGRNDWWRPCASRVSARRRAPQVRARWKMSKVGAFFVDVMAVCRASWHRRSFRRYQTWSARPQVRGPRSHEPRVSSRIWGLADAAGITHTWVPIKASRVSCYERLDTERLKGYALPPSPHPRRPSHPDCRSVLTLIVARH
jgi:hypothetical protein